MVGGIIAKRIIIAIVPSFRSSIDVFFSFGNIMVGIIAQFGSARYEFYLGNVVLIIIAQFKIHAIPRPGAVPYIQACLLQPGKRVVMIFIHHAVVPLYLI